MWNKKREREQHNEQRKKKIKLVSLNKGYKKYQKQKYWLCILSFVVGEGGEPCHLGNVRGGVGGLAFAPKQTHPCRDVECLTYSWDAPGLGADDAAVGPGRLQPALDDVLRHLAPAEREQRYTQIGGNVQYYSFSLYTCFLHWTFLYRDQYKKFKR